MGKSALILLISIGIVAATSANAADGVQADVDAGAVPMTTSQLTSLITNNTVVGPNWFAYYPEGKKRIVWYDNKTYKRKWKVDREKGFCVVEVGSKKWSCSIVWQVGPDTYRSYDRKGKPHTYTIEEGNIKGLK